METNNNKRVNNSNSGGRVSERSSSNNNGTYSGINKRAVKNPVPGDGGKKK